MARPNTATFHSPDELLGTARDLLSRGDPAFRRAIVLESITALEAMVHTTVFRLLEQKLPVELVEWLKEKTRMDFDARLSVLTPFATGQPVDRQSALWSRYKTARSVRNEVTHQGRRVTEAEAIEAIAMVEAWIVFLEQTGELDLSLSDLKEHIERRAGQLQTQRQATDAIVAFYTEAKSAQLESIDRRAWPRAPDIVLKFGPDIVPMEVKAIHDRKNLMNRLDEAMSQSLAFLDVPGVSRAVAVLLFVAFPIPERFEEVQQHADGRISVVGIALPALERRRPGMSRDV